MISVCALMLFAFGQTADVVADGDVVVARLSASQQERLPTGPISADVGERWLRVSLRGDRDETGPAMLGAYTRSDDKLVFRPRFGFSAGQSYVVAFTPPDAPVHTFPYTAPRRLGGQPATVAAIFPTADVLPANHLKFHIVFSQPMRGGREIFDQIQILDADGEPIPDPWLTDELWDAEGKELILYIHPGRIKWGLVLREILGPVLRSGRRYTLVIRETMLSAEGIPLGKDVTKTFRTTDEDRVAIDLSQWKLTPPAAGGVQPLRVDFPKSIDRASLGRFLNVVDDAGRPVAGTGIAGAGETSWRFTPARAWEAATYRLRIDGKLEDTAGNTPVRPFDLDLRSPPEPSRSLELSFVPIR